MRPVRPTARAEALFGFARPALLRGLPWASSIDRPPGATARMASMAAERLSVNVVWFLPFIRGDEHGLDVTRGDSLAVVGEPGRAPQITQDAYDSAGRERVLQP